MLFFLKPKYTQFCVFMELKSYEKEGFFYSPDGNGILAWRGSPSKI